MRSMYLAYFNLECKDEVCSELKQSHLVFAKVLTVMFTFLSATYLRMQAMATISKQRKRVYTDIA